MNTITLPFLDDNHPVAFPPIDTALNEPNGLLAAGGNLSPSRLIAAYMKGIFPWYSDDQPILWWSPDPRMVLYPDELHISRSLRKTYRRQPYEIRTDTAFNDVLAGCAAPRGDHLGTWLNPHMQAAYAELHARGVAHSVETWRDGVLVGGLYGLSIGTVFFGESMFSRATDASKLALIELCSRGYQLIDCQVENPHLASLGARNIPRTQFLTQLDALTKASYNKTIASWR